MTILRSAIAFGLFLLSATALAGESHNQPLVTVVDFAPLSGDQWTGSLSYLDYGSNTEQRIPVKMQFDAATKNDVRYQVQYPGETQYNESAMLKVTDEGRALNKETIMNRCLQSDGTLKLVTLSIGEDNDRSAEIRMTYSVSKTKLSIHKEVRWIDEPDFLWRNSYELTR